MTKSKRQTNKASPAPTVSTTKLGGLEGEFRELIAMVKSLEVTNADLAYAQEQAARASRKASSEAVLLDPLISKGEKFSRHKHVGAVKVTTQYLIDLSLRFPKSSAKKLYQIACSEAEAGLAPYEWDHADGGILLDGLVEINFEGFENRLSKAKNRHLR
jgi:hypothetical protein